MAIHKDVDPRGFLLNDNDIGVDHLGESTLADAIAESVHHVDTPITIGLFAKWGSGKSFLLRHIESILKRYQRQSIVDGRKKERYSENRITCSDGARAIAWTFCIFVSFAIILGTLLFAVEPGLLPWPPAVESKTTSRRPENSFNKTTDATTLPVEDTSIGPPPHLHTLRVVCLILLPLELLSVFLVVCCGNSWLSLHYYGSCRLLTYGAFTKLPVRNPRDGVVEDPGQAPTQVLKHIRPGDERLAIAASEAEIFSRRYIFVDFKAWEYAGSDTLWAGIVTNITDAIEAEFGVITARLFRMLTIEEVPRSVLSAGKRTLYVQLASGSKKDEVIDMMKQYGVVTECERAANEQSARPGSKWWQVVYACDGECRSAKECLKIEGVECKEDAPNNNTKENRKEENRKEREQEGRNTKESRKPIRESRKKLLSRKDDVEMKTFGSGASDQTDKEVLDRLTIPPKTFCCNRFCSHFLKYPTTLLCLPRLVWWILILLCSVLIPIIAYIVAEFLGLDVYRTYRAVPIIGQILLWLPAGAAVTAFTIKFIYAMCHSQRKRINEALDGTKTKMAEELGFMNTVKHEIQVVTKLVQCARFTHQKDYKIVITVDDLDRVPLKKVQSVLEAISILLSDKSSPFICFIAVDPRIVVKCIEEGMGEALKQSKVTGHEYLKKIINLPICLPEINDSEKKRYIAGLIDQADHTIRYRVVDESLKARITASDGIEDGNTTAVDHAIRRYHSDNALNRTATCMDGLDETDSRPHSQALAVPAIKLTNWANSRNNPTHHVGQVTQRPNIELDHKAFLFHCRKIIYHKEELHKHMQGNPRNIKRLFNVISLTACIIDSFLKKQKRRAFIQSHAKDSVGTNFFLAERDRVERTKKFAGDLVRWIILADQWPYRTSYILQVIEDAEQRGSAGIEGERIPEDWTILEIFENKVKDEYVKGDQSLFSLDADPDLFYSFIRLLKEYNFTAQKIRKLEKFTINLDSSIRHSIAFQRVLPTTEVSKPEISLKESEKKESCPPISKFLNLNEITESKPEDVPTQNNVVDQRSLLKIPP